MDEKGYYPLASSFLSFECHLCARDNQHFPFYTRDSSEAPPRPYSFEATCRREAGDHLEPIWLNVLRLRNGPASGRAN